MLQIQHAGGVLAARARPSRTSIFAHSRAKMQTSPRRVTKQKTPFPSEYVGASIARPLKNEVFRIIRRKITRFSPCGDRFCFSKTCGRPMVAPTRVFYLYEWAELRNCRGGFKCFHPTRPTPLAWTYFCILVSNRWMVYNESIPKERKTRKEKLL